MDTVSIHAAHEGGDLCSRQRPCDISARFNPRRPRGRRRNSSTGAILAKFQSTPPTRAATACRQTFVHRRLRFNPRRPRGRRRAAPGHTTAGCRVSIHAAHEGGDVQGRRLLPQVCKFQSTPPTRAATMDGQLAVAIAGVSIHAAHEGGDVGASAEGAGVSPVSIHAAHEGGDMDRGEFADDHGMVFQSTPPTRAATGQPAACTQVLGRKFQSTPPTRAATLVERIRRNCVT